MNEWQKLVDDYVRVCTIRGLSLATIGNRQRELERLGQWLRKRRPRVEIRKIDQDLIVDYVRSRTAFSSRATVASVMSELRCMGEYLVSQGTWGQNPLRWIRGPKLDPRRKLPAGIEPDHLRALFNSAANLRQTYHRQLMVTLLLVLYGTGIRRGELERLSLTDWDSQNGTLRINNTKSNLERCLPVPEAVAVAIEAYLPHRANLLAKRGKSGELALFVSRDGSRLSGDNVGVCVHRLAKHADVALVSIHQFRHACASDLLRDGVGIAQVQRVLGHACLSTTFRYTHVADPSKREAVCKHPINRILEESKEEGVRHE